MSKLPPEHGNKPPFEIPGTRHKDLLEWFQNLGFKSGAEIGVEAGLFSEEICKANPKLILYCIDPWKSYPGYVERPTQAELDTLYEEAIARLKPYRCRIIRSFSQDAHKLFDDESLDFVYIDGNHEFLHVAADIANWSPKVRVGGIIAGHDFRRNSRKYINDVKDVVPAYAYAKRINPWFILKEPVEASTWFWVKE
jgi:hypothetical protein